MSLHRNPINLLVILKKFNIDKYLITALILDGLISEKALTHMQDFTTKLILTYTSRGPLSRLVVGPAVFIIVPDDTAIHVSSCANCTKES